MSTPQVAAVVLALLVGCGICWWAAYRGKSSAVATAVAVAVAQANAAAEAEASARASAVAQQAVQIVLGADTFGSDPRTLWTARRAVEEVQASHAVEGARVSQANVDYEAARDQVGYL
jgi:hypothetical protein